MQGQGSTAYIDGLSRSYFYWKMPGDVDWERDRKADGKRWRDKKKEEIQKGNEEEGKEEREREKDNLHSETVNDQEKEETWRKEKTKEVMRKQKMKEEEETWG
jgi:hypothetical protein